MSSEPIRCTHAARSNRETPARFLDDALTFLDRERFESLVFEARDDLALVVIAHPALEGRKAARRGIGERFA